MNRAARRTPAGRLAAVGPRVWRGRRGAVVLGPTEDRVAVWLDRMTRHGRVTLPTARLIAELKLERSEAYRITRRLRVLGLFGIENDQGGAQGGRRYWRTAIEHDGTELAPVAHREAWARVAGALRATRSVAAQVAAITQARVDRGVARARATAGTFQVPGVPAVDFRAAMLAAGLLPWIAGCAPPVLGAEPTGSLVPPIETTQPTLPPTDTAP